MRPFPPHPHPRVVALGGGTGLPAVLRGLRGRAELTAVVTVADDGGSSGRLRGEGRVLLAPGDARNCLAALAPEDSAFARAIQHRFGAPGDLAGHTLGNLIIAALVETEGSFAAALDRLALLVQAEGRVVPATDEPVALEADLVDGRRVAGEAAIGRDPAAKLRVRLVRARPSREPGAAPDDRPVASPGIADTIARADLCVIGPGSLYTSVIPALLPAGTSEALRATRAFRVLVANLADQPGETDGYSVEAHLAAINEHAGGRVVDAVLVDPDPWPEDLAERYDDAGRRRPAVDPAEIAAHGAALHAAPLVRQGEFLRHDPRRLGDALLDALSRSRGVAERTI